MRRNLIAGLMLAIAAAGVLGATAVFGSDSAGDKTPARTSVDVRMSPAPAPHARAAKATGSRKPKVVYLVGEGSVSTAAPPAGQGPYIDFRLTATRKLCPRVVDGGIYARNLDFFQQGTYIDDTGQYHVLMALDDNATEPNDPPVTIPYSLHLICMRGVR